MLTGYSTLHYIQTNTRYVVQCVRGVTYRVGRWTWVHDDAGSTTGRGVPT